MTRLETWKDVLGYEGCYQVSDLGRVRSVGRKVPDKRVGLRSVPRKVLKQGRYPNGYSLAVL